MKTMKEFLEERGHSGEYAVGDVVVFPTTSCGDGGFSYGAIEELDTIEELKANERIDPEFYIRKAKITCAPGTIEIGYGNKDSKGTDIRHVNIRKLIPIDLVETGKYCGHKAKDLVIGERVICLDSKRMNHAYVSEVAKISKKGIVRNTENKILKDNKFLKIREN